MEHRLQSGLASIISQRRVSNNVDCHRVEQSAPGLSS